jgi:hypothetical protein
MWGDEAVGATWVMLEVEDDRRACDAGGERRPTGSRVPPIARRVERLRSLFSILLFSQEGAYHFSNR